MPRSWESSQAVTGTVPQGWTSEMGSVEGRVRSGSHPFPPAEPGQRGAAHWMAALGPSWP